MARSRRKLRNEYEFYKVSEEKGQYHYCLRALNLVIDVRHVAYNVYIKSSHPLKREAVEAVVIWLKTAYAGLGIEDYLFRLFGEGWKTEIIDASNNANQRQTT